MMRITEFKSETFRLSGLTRLDPIVVTLIDVAPGAGILTISCYGQAWTSYWGAMGERRVEQFVRECSIDYIVNKLTPGDRWAKNKQAYLRLVVGEVKAGIDERHRERQSITRSQRLLALMGDPKAQALGEKLVRDVAARADHLADILPTDPTMLAQLGEG